MLLLLFALPTKSEIATCMHDFFENKELRSREPEPLRKLQEKDSASRSDSTPQTDDSIGKYNFIVKFDVQGVSDHAKKEVIEKTFDYISNYFKEKIMLTELENKGKMNDAHLYVSVTVQKMDEKSTVLAFASAGSRHITGRPYEGRITINENKIPTEPQTLETGQRQFIMTLIHEFNHILSFSRSNFPHFCNHTGDKWKQSFRDEYDIEHTFLSTPKLTQWVNSRFHVRNETLKKYGLEIEDGGNEGTAGSHPNERLYFTDLMQGRTYGPGWLSPIFKYTLMDSCWYKPSEDLFEELVYLDDTLIPNIHIIEDILLTPPQKSFPKSFLCYSSALNACFYDYTYTGVCSLKSKSEVDSNYNDKQQQWYFPEDRSQVGSDDLLDHANVILPWYSCRTEKDGGLQVMQGYTDGYDPAKYGEKFIDNSTCALSTLVKDSITGSLVAEPKCYNAWCGTDKRVRLMVGEQEQLCKRDGDQVRFDGYGGSITCPPSAIVCANRKLKELFGASQAFPDRGPIDGRNLVAISGNDFLKYRNSVKITLGEVNCNIKIYKDNYILCRLDEVPEKMQKEIMKEYRKVILSKSENKYRMFKATYLNQSNLEDETKIPDFYVFQNRNYDENK